MRIFNLISRVTAYCKRHGFRATARRASTAARRALFSNRAVVFYCDLASQTSPLTDCCNSLTVERKKSYIELSPKDLHEILSFWNPKLAHRNMEERFGKGASLWLIKSDDRLAGYGWTLRGRAIAPYYFPFGEDDVQFFDFHLFPKYRGRAIDWFLVTYILHALAAEGGARAFAEAREWNQASLSSLTMTPFRRLGCVRKLTVFRHTMVCWDENELVPKTRKVFKAGAERHSSVTRFGELGK